MNGIIGTHDLHDLGVLERILAVFQTIREHFGCRFVFTVDYDSLPQRAPSHEFLRVLSDQAKDISDSVNLDVLYKLTALPRESNIVYRLN